MSDLRFPIGPFEMPSEVTPSQREDHLAVVESTPVALRQAVSDLDADKLATPYRDGGWSCRQVVHHLVDSHVNSYVRFKLALTEDTPTIRTYDEATWAELPDAKAADIETSLALLESLHRRWLTMLRSLGEAQWSRRFKHPEMGELRLDQNLALYAWHGRHHVAHITNLRAREGW